MKTLYILRHAKSSWEDPDLDDFQRPLNDRGKKDAPRMGKRLRKENVSPDLICSSPANRALATAQLVAGELGYKTKSIHEEPKLYHAGGDTILDVLHSLSDSHKAVMVVGHNPGLTEFANDLLNEEINNIPTAGFVSARLNINQWKEAHWGCGEMVLYEYPKKK